MTLPHHPPITSRGAFVTVVVVCFAVLCLQAWQVNKTRQIAHTNRALITRIADDSVKLGQLRKAQAASCSNFTTLRGAVNDFHGTIRSLLTGLIKTDETRAKNIRNPKLIEADRRSVRQLKRILAKTRTVTASCAQRPIGRGHQ